MSNTYQKTDTVNSSNRNKMVGYCEDGDEVPRVLLNYKPTDGRERRRPRTR